MSTKTMRLPPRRVLTPSNKRKEEEDGTYDAVQPSTTKKPKPAESQAGSQKEPTTAASSSSQLLAGYLAHEFLTKGTLFGQPFDAARAESSSSSSSSSSAGEEEAEKIGRAEPGVESLERYVAVADLLGADGAHLSGVFNPTQLARLLQL